MTGFYDSALKKCVTCPINISRCIKILKREYWIDCTENVIPYSKYYAGLRLKIKKNNITDFQTLIEIPNYSEEIESNFYLNFDLANEIDYSTWDSDSFSQFFI